MANNPRIDELRRRLDKEPRLFAQLAEELRKEGELAEAIRVCKEGLGKSPNYPSARLTLGRALLDSGNTTAAKSELEAALKGAPENILAGRLLAECLERTNDLPGALERYRTTLLFAPGDKQLEGRIKDLERRLPVTPGGGGERASGGPARPSVGPIPLATVDEPMELELSGGVGLELPPEPETPPTTEVGEVESDATGQTLPPGGLQPFDLGGGEVAAPVPVPDEFELESGYGTPASSAVVEPGPPAAPMAAAVPPAGGTAELLSPTLAEIYLAQGLTQEAISVYRRIVERDPRDERARARLAELQATGGLAAPAAGPGPKRVADAARRLVLQRTIERMETFLAAVRRASP